MAPSPQTDSPGSVLSDDASNIPVPPQPLQHDSSSTMNTMEDLPPGAAFSSRDAVWRLCIVHWRSLMVFVVPVVLSPVAIFWDNPDKPDAGRMAYCAMLMASFWILELVPLAITGILPVFLFPVLGVLNAARTCGAYFNEVQFIIMGGLIIAIAVEKSRVHERIALTVLMLMGSKPRWIMLGFMLVTAFLSMFLSNTATTAMMMPIANAILEEMRKTKDDEDTLMAQINPGPMTTEETSLYKEDPEKPKATEDKLELINKVEPPQSFRSLEEGKLPARGDLVEYDRSSMLDDIPALRSPRCTHSMLADGCTLHSGTKANDEEGKKIAPLPSMASSSMTLILASEQDSQRSNFNDMTSTAGPVRTSDVDKMLLLCVSYSAQLGGTGLLTGCTPNLVTLAYMQKRFPGSNMNFVNWSAFSFPAMLVVVLLGWVWLQICFMGFKSVCGCGAPERENSAVRALIRRKYAALGRLRFNEVAVMALFATLFLLWFGRDPGFARGYAVFFKDGFMSDAVPAIFICGLLFVLPAEMPPFLDGCFSRAPRMSTRPGRTRAGWVRFVTRRAPRLLDWDTVHVKMPWCIILIMGGGLALAEGMTASGLSLWLGERFAVFSSVPTWSLPFIVGAVVSATTDMASVMASCQIYTPVMADLALSLRLNPYVTLLPTTIAASFAFMLPVATPPAAIAFSYGKIRIIDMCKAGSLMNVIGVATVGLAVNTWGSVIFDLDTFPAWAEAALAAATANSTVAANVSTAINS